MTGKSCLTVVYLHLRHLRALAQCADTPGLPEYRNGKLSFHHRVRHCVANEIKVDCWLISDSCH